MGSDMLPELLMSSRLDGVQEEKKPMAIPAQPPVASEGGSKVLKMQL
jgi:hypothetical protein